MTVAARNKAEACFALARSTTFDGERESAVSRGIAIAEKAGLSLDDFDIPGRVKPSVRKPQPREYADDLFSRRPPPHYDRKTAEQVHRDFTDRMNATMADEFYRAFYGQHVAEEALRQEAARQAQLRAERIAKERRKYQQDQQRREMEEAIQRAAEAVRTAADRARTAQADFAAKNAAAKERDAKRSRRAAVDKAAADLWAAGVQCYPADDTRESWMVRYGDHLTTMTADDLLVGGEIAARGAS